MSLAYMPEATKAEAAARAAFKNGVGYNPTPAVKAAQMTIAVARIG